MPSKALGTLSLLAALFVLFSALWDPRISMTIAVAVLILFGVYHLLMKGKDRPDKRNEEKQRHKKRILTALDKKGELANDDIESLLGVSDATATRYMEELTSEGKVRRTGELGKYVRYQKP